MEAAARCSGGTGARCKGTENWNKRAMARYHPRGIVKGGEVGAVTSRITVGASLDNL